MKDEKDYFNQTSIDYRNRYVKRIIYIINGVEYQIGEIPIWEVQGFQQQFVGI